MITAYHRPQTLDEALTLLAQPDTIPLGGGTLINTPAFKDKTFAVVDLQDLGLNQIHKVGNNLEVGAAVTLQQLLESKLTPPALASALKMESALNIRNMATVAGMLIACDGRSPFATMMLALDAKIEQTIFANSKTESRLSNIGDFLPFRSQELITQITIPLNIRAANEHVARTPMDRAIVCAALAQWNSGRTRLALGGYGKSPTLAMDGTESDGLESAARNACHESADEWASAEYRMDVAATLAKRCLESIS